MEIFTTLEAALRAGYHVVDRYEQGYVVAIRTPRGFARALVDLRREPAVRQAARA